MNHPHISEIPHPRTAAAILAAHTPEGGHVTEAYTWAMNEADYYDRAIILGAFRLRSNSLQDEFTYTGSSGTYTNWRSVGERGGFLSVDADGNLH